MFFQFNSIQSIYLVSNYLAHKALITNKRLNVHFIKKFWIMYLLSMIKVLDVIFFTLLHNSTKDNLKHMYERTCWIFHIIIIFVSSVFSSNFTSVTRCSREKVVSCVKSCQICHHSNTIHKTPTSELFWNIKS